MRSRFYNTQWIYTRYLQRYGNQWYSLMNIYTKCIILDVEKILFELMFNMWILFKFTHFKLNEKYENDIQCLYMSTIFSVSYISCLLALKTICNMFLHNSEPCFQFFFKLYILYKQPQRYQSVNVAWRTAIRHSNLIRTLTCVYIKASCVYIKVY